MVWQARVGTTLAAIVATALILTVATSALLYSSQTVPFDGSLSAVNVGVYTNKDCTINCTSINAGTIAPGTSKTFTVYVKNTGNTPVTLSMDTSDWNPPTANGPITLTWNRENYILASEDYVDATLTLTVSSSISSSITSFSFKAVITGAG